MHELVTIIAKYFIAICIVVSLLVWIKLGKKQTKEFIFIAIVGGIISLLLAKLGSHLFYDSRPFIAGNFQPYFAHGNDNGFPSDHTLLASFLALLVWKYNKRLGQLLLLVAILIGLSRVIAGVHNLIDIVGSIVFAYLGYYLASRLIRFLTPTKPAAHTK